MGKNLLLTAGLLIAAPANLALAQDAGGAFNMGQLTGTLSQDHVTQSERARARGNGTVETSSDSASAAARNCASVSKLKARYGADDPRIVKVIQLCRQGGYEVR